MASLVTCCWIRRRPSQTMQATSWRGWSSCSLPRPTNKFHMVLAWLLVSGELSCFLLVVLFPDQFWNETDLPFKHIPKVTSLFSLPPSSPTLPLFLPPSLPTLPPSNPPSLQPSPPLQPSLPPTLPPSPTLPMQGTTSCRMNVTMKVTSPVIYHECPLLCIAALTDS